MSAMISDAIPASLMSVVKRVESFKISNRTLTIDTGSTASANGIIRVKLPTSGIHDMGSLIWSATNTVGVAAATMPHLEGFIQSLELTAGTESIVSITDFRGLHQMLCSSSQSTANKQWRYGISGGCGELPSYVITAGANVFNTLAEQTAAEAAAAIITTTAGDLIHRDKYNLFAAADTCRMHCLNFLSVQDLGVVDLSFFPDMTLTITLVSNSVMDSAGAATFALSNMQFTIDQYNLPAYTESALASLSSGETLKYPITKYNCNLHYGGLSAEHSLRLNVASSCLNRLWVGHRLADYNTQGAQVAGNPNKALTFSWVNTATLERFQVFKDGQAYPAYKVRADDLLCYSINALGAKNSMQYDNNVESLADWVTRKGFAVVPFSDPHGANNELSGASSNGSTSEIIVNLEWSAAINAAASFLTVAESTSILNVAANRVVFLQN